MPDCGIYAILDTQWVSRGREARAADLAARHGVAMIQYRDKLCRPSDAARSVVDAAQGQGCPVLINDDAALARATGAAGVHLGQSDMSLAQARQLLGSQAIIGVTCHADLALARAAQAAGADYVSFGRFFDSATKPQAPGASSALLTRARQSLSCPLVAIGGINSDNGGILLAAGADFLAVSAALFARKDLAAACRRLAALF